MWRAYLKIAWIIACVWILTSDGSSIDPSRSRNNMTQEHQEKFTVTVEFPMSTAENGTVEDSFSSEKYQRLRELLVRLWNKTLNSRTIASSAPDPTSQIATTEMLSLQTTMMETSPAEPSTVQMTTDQVTTQVPTTLAELITETTVETTTETPFRPTKRKRRATGDVKPPEPPFDAELAGDNIEFVQIEPKIKDGAARVSVFIDVEGFDQEWLLKTLMELNEDGTLQKELGYTVKEGGIYPGLPKDVTTAIPSTASTDNPFLIALIVILFAFIILVLVVCLIRRRRKSPKSLEKTQQPENNCPPPIYSGNEPTTPRDSQEIDWIIPYDQAILLNGKNSQKDSAEIAFL